MADNPTDAKSSAPGSSSKSLDIPAVQSGAQGPQGAAAKAAPTSDSKTPAAGITPSTPQPNSNRDSDAAGPTVRPVEQNNPKPVPASKQSVAGQAAKGQGLDSVSGDQPDPEQPSKADEDWDKPDTVDSADVYAVLEAAIINYVDDELQEDEDGGNPHFARHRNLSNAIFNGGALNGVNDLLHRAAEEIASHLNGAG